MTYAANDVVLGRHLDTAEKRIKREIDKIAAGGASVAVFTGATAVDGTSGLVPAPLAGDNGKFLRGDGTWAIVSGGSSTASSEIVLDTVPSTVDGGLWYEVIDDTPQMRLRFGDYEYVFAHDAIKFAGGKSATTMAYLPFDTSVTEDTCGNEWAVTGTPSIQNQALVNNGYTCLSNDTILDSIGSSAWTIDYFAGQRPGNSNGECLFGASTVGGYPITVSVYGNYLVLTYNNTPVYMPTAIFDTEQAHYALVYDGLSLRFFVGGVLQKTVEITGIQLSGTLVIGGDTQKSNRVNATFNHFRVTATALWSEDFTPPEY